MSILSPREENCSQRDEKTFPVLPTLFTLGNAVCGIGSITLSTNAGYLTGVENTLAASAILIFLAMVFDSLDGVVARWTRQTSEFGGQLDSLCDVISFGVAPAVLTLEIPHLYPQRVIWVLAVLYVLCTVLRLARYNVESSDTHAGASFTGLPSPAAAGMIASLAFVIPDLHDLSGSPASAVVRFLGDSLYAITTRGLPLLSLALACLMVSRIRYPHIVRQLLSARYKFRNLLTLVFAVVIVFSVHELAVPLVICIYVMMPPVRAARVMLTAKGIRKPPRTDEPLN